MNPLDSFTVQELKFMADSDHAQAGDVSALAKIALAAKQAKPVVWWTGPEPTATGELESTHDHETGSHEYPLISLGLPHEFMTKHLHQEAMEMFKTRAAPQLPAGQVAVELDMLHDYRDVKNAEVEHARVSAEDRPGSRWERDFRELKAELEAIDAAISNAPKPDHIEKPLAMVGDGWIKCSERMPEEAEVLLVSDGEIDIYPAIFYKGKFYEYGDTTEPCLISNPTHWMPLPPLPKPE